MMSNAYPPESASTSANMAQICDRDPDQVMTNKVGLSVFYDCIDLSPTAEKQDTMKADRSDTEEESKQRSNSMKEPVTFFTHQNYCFLF